MTLKYVSKLLLSLCLVTYQLSCKTPARIPPNPPTRCALCVEYFILCWTQISIRRCCSTLYTPTKSKDGHHTCRSTVQCTVHVQVYFKYARLLFNALTHTDGRTNARKLTLMCLVAISKCSAVLFYSHCCTTTWAAATATDLLSRSRFPFLSDFPIQPTKNAASFALPMFASHSISYWTLTSTSLCAASVADGAAYWAAGCHAAGKILKWNLPLASTWPKKKTMTFTIN